MPEIASNISYAAAAGLGAVQGVTEFLPVSSSAHLALAQHFLGIGTANFFDLMLHLGTLCAVVWFCRGLFRPADGADPGVQPPLHRRDTLLRIGLLVALAVAPAGSKLFFHETRVGEEPTWRSRIGDLREQAGERPWMVLGFLSITSVVLLTAARATGGRIDATTMQPWHAVTIGIAQAFSALCPGLSRSGMTISAALLLGLRPAWAVNFSLLMSIPTIIAATVVESRKLEPGWFAAHAGPTLLGTTIAGLVGWASLGLLAKAATRGRWGWFAAYLWAVIAASAAALAAGIGDHAAVPAK